MDVPSKVKRVVDGVCVPRLLLVIDIETTGRSLEKDALISVGYCGGYLRRDGTPQVVVEASRIDVTLGKSDATSWENYWEEMGWDQNCYDAFWGANLDLLSTLQTQSLPLNEALGKFNDLLTKLEEEYDVLVATDAHYDLIWLSHLFSELGFESLDHTRTGESRRCLDLYSYMFGMLGLSYLDAAPGHMRGSIRARARMRELFSRTDGYEHPHSPEKDAAGLLHLALDTFWGGDGT